MSFVNGRHFYSKYPNAWKVEYQTNTISGGGQKNYPGTPCGAHGVNNSKDALFTVSRVVIRYSHELHRLPIHLLLPEQHSR